ncbi:MAG TPA: ATP-binding protein [Bryobacteraceae bacterium]|jgi:light-regulated signal transduction histidine kinase (bacteriophytochrome)|nr:ATP-binding protein [Bryobacteraceae bacterium]
MGESGENHTEDKIERLRQALDAETRACHALQRQLDQADAEFEEFVSMAAHNLRELLRDVASYSQLMAETNAGVYLERIQEAAAGAQSLLGDIVDYWATGTGERFSSRTDMEVVLNQALLSTDDLISERNAVVTHDSLPAVMGNFEILTKILHHLIRNAIAYCDTPAPRVHVSAKQADLEYVFSVKDNGPGIEPAFQGRLFGAFKRLHGKEHPGNGLGLAFCKKAIERHGGRMWMESSPGDGSTFYFTLPSAQ